MDRGELQVERDGLSARQPARWALVALDEAEGDDPPLSAALADRVGLWLPLAGLRWQEAPGTGTLTPEAVAAARARLPAVRVAPALHEALAAATLVQTVTLTIH
jgi:magnesium chelatase subunit D